MSKITDEWRTPKWFFEMLQARYGVFELDAAASRDNALCSRYFDEQSDGLAQPWPKDVRIFCNPPWSNISPWVKKALNEECHITLLLPANRSDQEWFHELLSSPYEIVFHRGRLSFEDPTGKGRVTPRDPTMHVNISSNYNDSSIQSCNLKAEKYFYKAILNDAVRTKNETEI